MKRRAITADTLSGQRNGEVAAGILGQNLPPDTYRDTTELLPLKEVIGLGVILLDAAIGSGEHVVEGCAAVPPTSTEGSVG